MIRRIISIDEDKCNGCGLCVTACVEGAIEIVNGKAKLVKDSYCDGLGACIGECPVGAITIIEREAEPFDETTTKEHKERVKKDLPCGCPSSASREILRSESEHKEPIADLSSQLSNWPVQLMLVSPYAPYLNGADVLLSADCVPFAYADFHRHFINGRKVIIGCPKLDDTEFYIEKLSEIFKNASPNSITIVHMEVPCCSGLIRIANKALALSGKNVPINDVSISISGEILEEKTV